MDWAVSDTLRCHVWPSTGHYWLYHRMTTGSRPTQQQRQALCVCIYVIGQAREAKCGQVFASARENTGQSRPFSPTPSGSTPYFPTSRPGIAPSLWMSSSDGTEDSKHDNQIGGSQGWGSGGEAWVNKSNVRPQRNSWYNLKCSVWACLVWVW